MIKQVKKKIYNRRRLQCKYKKSNRNNIKKRIGLQFIINIRRKNKNKSIQFSRKNNK